MSNLMSLPAPICAMVWCTCVFASGQELGGDLLAKLAEAKKVNENYYLRNVTILTLERDFDETGTVLTETKHRYIAGEDRFLKQVLLQQDVRRNAPTAPEDVWIGRPEGIFRVRPRKNNQYLIAGTMEFNDENAYAICRGDFGISLPVADLDLPLVNVLQLRDLTIKSLTAR